MLKMITSISLLKYFKCLNFSLWLNKSRRYCFACGEDVDFHSQRVIGDDLARRWNLSLKERNIFDRRESLICPKCGNSYRIRQLARAIVEVFKEKNAESLKYMTLKSKRFRKLKIAEINSCANLHPILEKCPNLSYSEYRNISSINQKQNKNFQKIKKEDLQGLTYKNNSFNLILTSDTLEHVPDFRKGLREVYRVLAPRGYFIFTIPVITGRNTLNRITIDSKGRIKENLPKSYHGLGEKDNLVCHEFGIDILGELEKIGFEVKIYFYNVFIDDYSYVFVAKKCSNG